MDKSKKYVLEAPDGGWGYVVLAGFIINVSVISSMNVFYGIIFHDYFVFLKMDSVRLTLLNGLNAIAMSLAGFLTAPLLKYMPQRYLGYSASAAFNFGLFCTVFAQSQLAFFIFQIVQSVGVGMTFNLNTSAVNEYFVKNRVLAISITQTIIAILAFFTPLMIQWCFENFGSRGTLLILCCVTIHMFLATTVIQPVKWHMRRVEITPKEVEANLLLEEHKKITEKMNNTDNGNDEMKEKDGFWQLIRDLLDVKLFRSFTFSMPCVGPSLCIVVDLLFVVFLPQALQQK
ncbi:unnamed protein product [Leptidea sinapis]|uniref:Major facilitator superfamily (MFS) profile domain-containing protein n=3 Tax=Leptidea sinapis TaxID=189913 RepID=A0A5E4QD24_9NEOP|nr:unnamed protein product [Leptidea sinapis]